MKFRTFVKNYFLIMGLGGVGAVIHQYTGLLGDWYHSAVVLDTFLTMFYVGSWLVGRVVKGKIKNPLPKFYTKTYEELEAELK